MTCNTSPFNNTKKNYISSLRLAEVPGHEVDLQLGSVNETENIVQHVVTASFRNNLEYLAELEGIGAVIDHQQARDHDQEIAGAISCRWLDIGGGDLMLNLGERKIL